MNSIKVYLISSILAIIVLVLFVSTIHGYNKSMRASEQLFDSKLADVANLLASIYSRQDKVKQQPKFDSSHLAFRAWDNKKRLIASSLAQDLTVDFSDHSSYQNFDSDRWRTQMRFYPEYKRWIWVAERQEQRFELAEGIILESIIPSLVVIPIIGIIILLIVTRGIYPIKELASQIASRKANDLQAITMEEIPSELIDLTESVNQLFTRLDSSFKREKRLASDAAHELRTPIAALELQVQNLIAEVPANTELQGIVTTTRRLSHLVEQILTLNKTTPELFARKMIATDITPLVRNVVANVYPLLDAKQQTIEMDAESAVIETDQFAIETLFGNLLSNAIKYTPEGGKIRIKIFSRGGLVNCEIHDDGWGILPELRPRVLERFYRLDRDRSNAHSTGCGLGFSIIQHIVELHNGSFSLCDSEFSSGLAVKVIFNQTDFLE